MTTPTRILANALAAAVACTSLLPAAPAAAAPRRAPTVDAATYPATRNGFEHFLQDQLPGLVAGQAWDWRGQRYEVRRLHSIVRESVLQPPRPRRGRDAAMTGHAVATIHVMVDGRLKRGRIEIAAGYHADEAGWRFEQAVLFLGNGESWDFVRGEVV